MLSSCLLRFHLISYPFHSFDGLFLEQAGYIYVSGVGQGFCFVLKFKRDWELVCLICFAQRLGCSSSALYAMRAYGFDLVFVT